jgi:putative ribosome biogenesis GTPase RsgA
MTKHPETGSEATGTQLAAAVLRLPPGVGKSTLLYWAVCDGRVRVEEISSALQRTLPHARRRP